MPSPTSWYATNARLLQEERRMTHPNGTDSETFAAMTPKQLAKPAASADVPVTAAGPDHHCCSGCSKDGHCTHGLKAWYTGYDRGARNVTEVARAEAEASGSAGADRPVGAAAPDVDVLRADIAQAIHDALTSPPAHEPSYPDTVADRIVARLLHKEPTDE